MAEFTEVMRQARRMCKEQQNISCCVRCPINKNGCMVVADAEYVDYADAEREIMHWAAEHPEPVYPTWNEWYRKNFPDAYDDGKRICPVIFGGGESCDNENDCDKCRDRPIPADIAEKLGIKPKEAK
nr:MAG TPA: hypothetical protein [Caudoviricetes sp.]